MITELGWATLFNLLLGVFLGGSPHFTGFHAGLKIEYGGDNPTEVTALFTPMFRVDLPGYRVYGITGGITLGGTTILAQGQACGDSPYLTDMRAYEEGHVAGFENYGLVGYAYQSIAGGADPCFLWGVSSAHPQPRLYRMNYGAIEWKVVGGGP